MHGAASPFTWQGLSPYDAYQQAAQGLQPPAVLPQLPAQPQHIPHMPSVMNPRLPVPWINPDLRVPTSMDAYLYKLQGINGYSSRSRFEPSHRVTDAALASTLPAFHSLSERKNESDLYSNSLNKNDSVDNVDSGKEKMRGTFSASQFGSFQNVTRDVSPFLFLPSTREQKTHIATHSGDTFSDLTWKNAYFTPPSSIAPTSLCVSSQSSTSAELMPVSTTAASVIPYYSNPRDIDTYSLPNGLLNDAASKEAARILEEANVSNMKSGYASTDRKLESPFTNISNKQRQLPSLTSEQQGLHVPSSSYNYHNFHLKAPIDYRPENHIQGSFSTPSSGHSVGRLLGQSTQAIHRPSAEPIHGQSTLPMQGQSVMPLHRPPSESLTGDFWSEFGLPPPNVELDQGSHTAAINTSKRTANFLNDSAGILHAQKRPKQDENIMKETDSDMLGTLGDQLGKEKFDDKKRPEKLTRRKSFTDDPVIDALVDAKVQEIMAACKEKEQTKDGIEKPKPVKSPKYSSQPSNVLYDKPQVHLNNQTGQFQDNQSNRMQNNVYDFSEGCDDMNVQNTYKDLPQQVMDVRRFNKEKHIFKSSNNSDQKYALNTDASHKLAANEITEKMNQGLKHKAELNSHHRLPFFGNGSQQKAGIDTFNSDISNQTQNVLHRQILEVENKTYKGTEILKATPCCNDCDRSGKKFSEECQNSHQIFHKKGSIKEDPFQFSDNSSSFGPFNKGINDRQENSNCFKSWNNENLKTEHEKFVNSYEKIHAGHEYAESKYSVQYLSENKKKINMNYMDKYRGISKKGFKLEKTSQKLKSMTSKFDRPQGQLSATKKFGSKPYGIKSSFTLLKKSQKFHNVKLPSIRKKWKNNPKYKKIQKDDFAEKLMKNLGFPPLTLKDLISKRHCKLPQGYMNGHSTIAASMLNAEDKAASRGSLPVIDSGTNISVTDTSTHMANGGSGMQSTSAKINSNQEDRSSVHISQGGQSTFNGAKYHRSRSADKTFPEGDPDPAQRSRSWSCDTFKGESGIKVSNDTGMYVDKERVKTMSEQINGLRELITGQQSNLEHNTVIEVPQCGCPGTDDIADGPYYTHLGAGRSVEAIRKTLEGRTGHTGKAIRIEKVRYTGKEGKSPQGCPIAKWIVRRSSIEEKYLALVRHRVDHSCETAWLIIALVAWEGVPASQADDLYDYLSGTLPSYGNETERRCGTNDRKTCACQGADLMKRGASFSFGCSWSMYFNGCKFARSTHARKFRLKNEEKEAALEKKLQDLASHVGPLYKQCAPDAHNNQCYYSEKAKDCRLGDTGHSPFSGVTACLDFCAHAHKDIHNMNNGSTVVVTLTKHRGLSKPEDEQLHVLPLYVLDPTDEAGSYEAQYDKIKKGSLEVLHQFPLEARMRAHPLQSCKKRRMSKKGRGGSRHTINGRMSPWDTSSSAQSTPKKDYLHSQDALLSPTGSHDNTPVKQPEMKIPINSDKPISYDDLMAMSTQAGFNTLYDKFWDYFYAFGVFPPPSILAASLQSSAGGLDKSLHPGIYKLDENMRQQDKQNHVASVDPVTVCSVPSRMAKSQDKQHMASFQDQQHMAKSQDHQHNSSMFNTSSVEVENPFSDPPQYYGKAPPHYGDAINYSFQDKQASELHPGMHAVSHKDSRTMDLSVQAKGTASYGTSGSYPPVLTNRFQESDTPAHSSSQQTIDKPSFLPSKHQSDTQALDLSFSSSNSKSDRLAASLDLSDQKLGSVVGQSVPEPTKSHSQYNLSDPSQGTSVSYQSPLDLLSQAVDIRSKHVGYSGALSYVNSSNQDIQTERAAKAEDVTGFADKYSQENNSQPRLPTYDGHYNTQRNNLHAGQYPSVTPESSNSYQPNLQKPCEQAAMTAGNQCWKPYDPHKSFCLEKLESVHTEQIVNPEESSLPDPDVVKCKMEYNEEAFLDPNIGGVAIALSHRAVLFEVAKRELHATTGLKNPNRYHPTRISLVFYQHKNLNNERHGMYAYEQKLEDLKMKRIEKMQLERGYVDMQEIENSFKGGKKRKLTVEEAEIAQLLQSSKGEYKFLLNCSTNRCDSNTTETVSTKWIDPSPIVTGPYQKWV